MSSKTPIPELIRRIAILTALTIAQACERSAPIKMHEPFTVGSLGYSIESTAFRTDPPYRSAMLRPPPPDRVYLVVSHKISNHGDTTVDIGLPPFEVRTEDGQRFRANALLSMLYPMERSERSGSLQAMADVINTELNRGLSGTYEVAFALTTEVFRQPLSLIAKGPWLGFPETTVALK